MRDPVLVDTGSGGWGRNNNHAIKRVSWESVMTRMFRAIPLSCVRLSLLSAVASVGLIASSGSASAGIFDFLTPHSTDTVQQSDDTNTAQSEDSDAPASDAALGEIPDKSVDADAAPSIETPLHHLYCVEYARIRSGLQIFGDAKTWWASAKSLYDEFTAPAANAVMVFAGSSRIRRGHVAVVTAVVSPREIRVDQANWQNHGEIDHNTPVIDVSPDNDWSQVRVWDMKSGQYGGHVYAISGFIGRTAPTSRGS
jgi:CHAP domain